MDQVLAGQFRQLGGELRENARWDRRAAEPGVVLANGRRPQAVESSWRWFGLKVHARRVELDADLEMHGSDQGYVGLCRLSDGEVNVCGLFRTRPGSPANSPKQLLRGAPGTPLHERLRDAVFDEDSFCSVAGLALQPQRASGQNQCRLGDALTMIPPVTGNGMSMAFEAADLALAPISAYARGELDWQAASRAVAQACDAAFRRRLFWAKWFQWIMFSRTLQGKLGKCVLACDPLWHFFVSRTR
jgi:2-polyprenyl-6-methoxyphenol hydroxylase-like FAD-dependent oxidoreductase